MKSICLHCKGAQSLRKIIVCDGYTLTTESGTGAARKGRRITPEKANDYKEYVSRLKTLCKSGSPYFSDCEVLVLDKLHGFGLAMQQALKLVKTPYVVVAQHDRMFRSKGWDLEDLCNVLKKEQKVNYIGYLSHRQLRYRKRMVTQHKMDPKPVTLHGVPLIPLFHFLDSMHIARKSFWKYMFDSGTIKVRDFPEHTFGNEQRWDIVKNGIKAFDKYGTYLLWDMKDVIQHVNGRTYFSKEQRVEKGFPENKELNQLFKSLEVEEKKRK
eukprot:CAMPEP_0167748624 /NCGR_PEP_ID=MMETSP0110_2-20121227/4941_1 /TAXON_ID=629695 /ORGANISM="Gymnochlora sp., Strain CCMP2014" /LENGTH=268 /DNA_ID=CAMNT_0007633659 /DNA_START=78 /DNA_END=884 /DNA_ORIENTATION=+